MSVNTDPYYNRKQVPDEFLEHVGDTGLSKQEESINRERKYSKDGGDVRKFWNPRNKNGELDPHYARKPVPDALIKGVGETGLSPEEEYQSRERKYSVNGVDVRKFSKSTHGGMEPQSDPYYGRKPVGNPEITGVGDTGYSKAEEYEQRERKQSLFQESSDPFQQFSGAGHRQSVSDQAGPGAAYARRKSSALAPDAMAAATHTHGGHSGYGGETLEPIESRSEFVGNENSFKQPLANTTSTNTATTTTTTGLVGGGEHALVHDIVTHEDPDSVAPHVVA